MRSARSLILNWEARGAIPAGRLEAAMLAAGVLPDGARWRRFIDALLMWLGVVMLGASLVFFLAYNWEAMGRYAKFALAEGAIVAALAGMAWLGLDRAGGKALLLMASLFVGALLALVGQTYQTGADPWELFAVWAALILPWTLMSRLAAQWLLTLGLVNVAAVLYYTTFQFWGGPLLRAAFGPIALSWFLLSLNAGVLACWELARGRGYVWMADRWAPRVIGLAAGTAASVLGMWAVLGFKDAGAIEALGWFGSMAAIYTVYRWLVPDLFMLAAGALSLIVLGNTYLARHVVRFASADSFFFMSLLVIGSSAAAGWWLRRVGKEFDK